MFIEDVMRELQEAGGVESARARLNECLIAHRGHDWRDLRPDGTPGASYRARCLIVSLSNVEFWPVEP